ncbi:MAG: outer membrane beta-barrel protein [Candidatus Omnitrophota bacterium]
MKYFFILFSVFAVIFSVSARNGFCAPVGGGELKLDARLSEYYDDNITYADDNAVSDAVSRLSVGLKAGVEGKLEAFVATLNVSHEFYAQHSMYDNTSEDFSARYNRELSKFDRVVLKETLRHADEPSSFEEAFETTPGRYQYLRNNFEVSYIKDISSQLALSLTYANEGYWRSRADLSNSFLNRWGLEGRHAVSSATILLFSYNYLIRSFDPGTSAKTNDLSAGIIQYITKQLYLDINGGLDLISSYNNEDYVRGHFSFSLINDVDENTSARLSFYKRYEANSSEEDLFNNWRISGALTHRLLERLSGTLSAFYGSGTYETTDITDNFTGVNTAFVYDFAPDIKGELSYFYAQTSSDRADREYTKNRVTASVRVSF